MGDEVYQKLAKVLDTLPNGFPTTESGLEIKILKKIFTPEEANLFCDLKMTYETAEQIAERTGRSLEGLEEMLTSMWHRGEIFGVDLRGVKSFAMAPWIIGIFELQLNRLDREFVEMCEEYGMYFGPQLLAHGPAIMQVIPVEKTIPVKQEALSYERVSHVIENGKSFSLNECICKKERGILGNPCEKPHEVCLAIAPEPGWYDNSPSGRTISKEQAYEVLRKSEEAGLVHLTTNVQEGHWFICNCCKCCCGVLRAINLLGITEPTNAHYYAEIDPDKCTACGTCADERCQVHAIEESEDAYRVKRERCIGCGLCVSACPSEAIRLIHKPSEEIVTPPMDQTEWFDERARRRGVDYSAYK